MGYVVRLEAPRRVELAEYEDPPLDADAVRLATLYSGISAGTELTAYAGTNPYVNKRWDAERRLFVEGNVTHPYPSDSWGYEEVGRVIEAGPAVRGVAIGDVVYGKWGHRSGHVMPADWAAAHLLAPGVDPMIGVFARIGAVALNAILDASLHVGEFVAVFGQGVPGLIVTQLARLSGATVIAVDGIPRRLELAERLGAHRVVDFTRESAAEVVKELTGGRGADVSVEISGSYSALHEAIRATAYNSRVVVSGFAQGEGIGLLLGEEYHHNRIELVGSQASGVARDLQHRWGMERLERTLVDLASEGRIDVTSLVSHVIPAAEASDAFGLLAERPREAVQVVLAFDAPA